MHVTTFSCVNLNAFLTYDIAFHADVSFLHGINGSGKTSILRAIVALLTPDPTWLCNTSFDRVSVGLEVHGIDYTISADSSDNNSIHFIISGGIEVDNFVSRDELLASVSSSDDVLMGKPRTNAFQSIVNASAALQFISKLPTPIFLGLDRTTLSPSTSVAGWESKVVRHSLIASLGSKTVSPYSRTQLDDAIKEAEQLLKQRLSSLSNERNYIFETLRNDLVLSLFQMPGTDEEAPEVPDRTDKIERIPVMEESIIAALQKIRVKEEQIDRVVRPFFRAAFELGRRALDAQEVYSQSENKSDDKVLSAFIDGIVPYERVLPSLLIIEGTLRHIETANELESAVSTPLNRYLANMNAFFSDSRKKLMFQDNSVKVELPSGALSDLNSLSSGERQIFVLLTHLMFNPAMSGENILLIDEPELSLHLKWQRQFVSSVRDASPTTQMILATHSPEIIFDLDDKLIALEM